jgi:hypothetical protein
VFGYITSSNFKAGVPMYFGLCGQTGVNAGGTANVTIGKLFLQQF